MHIRPILLNLLPLAFLIPSSALAFSDVPANDTHAQAIIYVKEKGMVSGYADGTFHPDALINRAEFTKIVLEATDEQISGNDCFPDVRSEWFAPYVCTALKSRIIAGYPDGSFKPEQTISFAEASKIIANAFALEPLAEPSTWYAPFILALEEKGAIPTDINQFSQSITRAQMAEMIFRLHAHETNLPSHTFVGLGGKTTVTVASSSMRSSISSTKPATTVTTNPYPYTLPISENWQQEWTMQKIEGTAESLPNVEVQQNDEKFGNFFRIHFPKGTGDRSGWKSHNIAQGGVAAWINPHIKPTDKLYMSYYVRFPKEFSFSYGGTLPGLFTGMQNNRAEESTAAVYPVWGGIGSVYIMGSSIDKTENLNSLDTDITFIGDDEWHRVDIYAQLQTRTGKINGIVELSIDGQLVRRSSQILFSNNVNDFWDGFMFVAQTSWLNAYSPTAKDMHLDLAGFTFTDKRIP